MVEALFILDKYGSIFLFIEYNYMRVKISFDPHIIVYNMADIGREGI